MALVLKVKDVFFTTPISTVTPPSDPFSFFRFGRSLESSSRDRSGNNNNLVPFGKTSGITFTTDSMRLPQTGIVDNALLLKGLQAGSFTLGWSVKDGQFEKLGSFATGFSTMVTSNGQGTVQLVDKNNVSHILDFGSATTRPYILVVVVDVLDENNIKLSFKSKNKFGEITSKTETYTAQIRDDFNTQDLRIGSLTSGFSEIKNMIAYKRALSDNEVDALLAFLG